MRSPCCLSIRVMTALLVAVASPASSFAAISISDPLPGGYSFNDTSGSGADELSGITYAGGDTYHAVSDNQAKVFTMTISVNPATGQITSSVIGSTPLQLNDAGGSPITSGTDLEGIAFDGSDVWISNETGPELSRYDLGTGDRAQQMTTSSHAQLNVFSNIRGNKSWESMARQPDGGAFWTTNEEALTVDGPLSTTSDGTVVRLQKFDAAMNPIGQWAYQTEPIDGDFMDPYNAKRIGVADLLALDGGGLLALERSFGGLHFNISIYELIFAGATDISQAPWDDGLIGETYTPVSKTELWSHDFPLGDSEANFEGLTLGPQLDDGSWSLIMAADSNLTDYSLYALTISGITMAVPEPSTCALLAVGAVLLTGLCRRRRRKKG